MDIGLYSGRLHVMLPTAGQVYTRLSALDTPAPAISIPDCHGKSKSLEIHVPHCRVEVRHTIVRVFWAEDAVTDLESNIGSAGGIALVRMARTAMVRDALFGNRSV